jgi:hypothetical protein
VVPIPFQLPDLLRVLPLVPKILLPRHDAIVPPLVPIGLTEDGLPSALLYQPKLLEDVDVVPLEAIVAADVLPRPRLLELPPDLLGVPLAVLEEVVADEEGRGIYEGRGPAFLKSYEILGGILFMLIVSPLIILLFCVLPSLL